MPGPVPARVSAGHRHAGRAVAASILNGNAAGGPMKSELKKLYDLIEEIEIAMMTTRRPDGHLESRAMANQKAAAGADLWFVTAEGTSKLRDLKADPHINLSYYKDRTREWISVSGIATISRDRDKIRELYAPDWKMWFEDEGGSRDGSVDDPRFVLIGVDVHAAVFLEVNKPQPVVLYEMLKGWATGNAPEIGEMHRVEEPHR
jgi:general stress protein 26